MPEKSAEQIVRDYLSYVKNPHAAVNNGFSARLREKLATENDAIMQLRLLSAIEIAEQVDGESLRDEFVAVARTFAEEAGLTTGSFRQLGVPDDVLHAAGLLGEERHIDLRNSTASNARTTSGSALAAMGIDLGDRPEPGTAARNDDADWERSARTSVGQMNGSGVALLVPPETDDDTIDADGPDTYTSDPVDPKSKTRSTKQPAHDHDNQGRSSAEPGSGVDGDGDAGATRGRVTQAQIRSMLPDEPFTMKSLSELTGASLLTVRKAVESLQDKGIVKAVGQDPDHKGVGRSPMRYQRKR